MQPAPAPAGKPGWPFVDYVVAPIAEWWKKRAAVRDNLAHLQMLGPDECARMAHDLGVAASDLQALATHTPDSADLLDRRLSALGLDEAKLMREQPAQMRDLERVCTMCASKGRCTHDLDADPRNPAWRSYCPNSAVLTELKGTAPLREWRRWSRFQPTE